MAQIEAGPIKFDLSHRDLMYDQGVCIRVLGDVDGDEKQLLRFDCFDQLPHYHYDPEGSNEKHDIGGDEALNPKERMQLQRLIATLQKEGETIETDPEALANIERGVEAAKRLGADDLGQAAVVSRGKVVGLEDSAGTDALLARVGNDAWGGVLVKVSKPDQERRVDLPSIGVATVERVSDAGISGIAVEAGNTLIMGRDDVVRAADAAGIFIVGVKLSKTELS